jgi:hypothetical protein
MTVGNRGGAPIVERRAMGRQRAAGSLLPILVLVLCSCSPVERDSFSERAPGVSVTEHWATLLDIEDSLERTAAMAQFMTSLGPEDSDAVGELATRLFRRHRSIDDLILMNAWSRLDAERAWAIAMVSQSTIAEASRADGVLEWASRDPMKTIDSVDVEEAAVRRSLVRGWYESGVPGLPDYVINAGASRAGQNLIASYALELSSDLGAQGVAEWIDSVRGRTDLEPIMITHAHRKGISAMAVADVEAAIAYCDLHCDEPYADSARARLADRLGMLGQAERAIAWVEGSRDANQEDRGRAGRMAFRAWLRADHDAALGWADEALGKYKDESWFSPLARLALGFHTRREPEAALVWVEILPEGQEQEDALIKIARRWRKLDENAAEAWIETSPLDDEARAKARTPTARRTTTVKPKPDPAI